MLEVVHLKKIYKGKNGNDVTAIDDVSLSFPEKGMVFLLGKSGSGKSTLLNLCGGLDFPDSGEIIIKGRSSKDFSQADFDSYRNTFVGFVFQEYNILDEFSVENNIALALELQGKNKDKQAVAAILEQVELADFAKRKPNTLSGGQKQRVAIARALVKNPEIILADEPTGALDSNTGKQVFDTLKKLSEQKLVIIVSHDREFAEIYADRIIELKDGKVISDVTKSKVAATEASENVSFIGNDTVSVKSGSALTDEDMAKIKDFLTEKGGNVIIASGDKDVSAYKKVAKIDDNNAKETFFDTDVASLTKGDYSDADSKLIRSKLPLKHAVKIGASGLKVKPFRLFFTIFLSFIAFAMFGLFSTLTFYNEKNTAVSTYKNSGYDYMYMAKKYNYTTRYYSFGEDNGYYSSSYNTRFTTDDFSKAKEKYGKVYGAYDFSTDRYSTVSGFKTANTKSLASAYYSTDVKMFVEVDGNQTDFELLTDTDIGALGDNDVIISSFMFDSIKEAGLFNGYTASSGYVTLNDYNDIVGKTLAITDNYMNNITPLTVRGVYKAAPSAEYDALKDKSAPANETLSTRYTQLINSGMYNMVLVSPKFYNAHLPLMRNSASYVDFSAYSLRDSMTLGYSDDSNIYEISYFSSIIPFGDFPVNREIAVFFREGQTALAENEVLIPFTDINRYVITSLNQHADKLREDTYNAEYEKEIQQYRDKYASEIAAYREQQYQYHLSQGYSEELAKEYAETDVKYYTETLAQENDPSFFNKLNEKTEKVYQEFTNNINFYMSVLESGNYNKDGLTFTATSEDIKNALDFIWKYSDPEDLLNKPLTLRESSGGVASDTKFTCVGFVYGSNTSNSCLYVNDAVYKTIREEYGNKNINNDPNGESYFVEETKFVESADAKYNYLVLPFPDDEVLSALVSDENIASADDSFFRLATPLSDQLQFANTLISTLEKIFLWTGVAMALFSMLLLFNFISVSISNKKKEIGILRAVGARSLDVFKIFYSESAIITVICYVLAIAACLAICPLINTQIASALGGVSIITFGPLSWLIMLGIAVVTSIVATFLPVFAIAKKRPVESIRSL